MLLFQPQSHHESGKEKLSALLTLKTENICILEFILSNHNFTLNFILAPGGLLGGVPLHSQHPGHEGDKKEEEKHISHKQEQSYEKSKKPISICLKWSKQSGNPSKRIRITLTSIQSYPMSGDPHNPRHSSKSFRTASSFN